MKYCFFFILVILVTGVNAQLLQVDAGLTDQQRINQLLQEDTNSISSFTIRNASNYWSSLQKPTLSSKMQVKFLFAGYSAQHNSNLPISYNDGNFMPNVGLQQKISFGFSAKWGILNVHLQPELIRADNLPGSTFRDDRFDTNYRRNFYWHTRNKIDNGFRFGNTPLQQFFWGQSSVRIQNEKLSFGISTENLWWGPSARNSLLLTNHAPGFLHLTLNSTKPIKTSIGHFEFQSILGNLDSSTTNLIDFSTPHSTNSYIEQKFRNNRSIAGYWISWNPKWFKDFFVGIGGVSYFYKNKPSILPSPNLLNNENRQGSASLSSVFFRYAMPADHAEVYFEYGRSGKIFAPTNIIGDTISTGYTVGFRKLFKLKQLSTKYAQSAILISIELTQLQLPDNRLIFNQNNVRGIPKTNSWYTDAVIRQGYTNQGQVLGASIGPGSNSQTLNLSWVKGLKRVGFTVERINHNADFYQYHYFNGRIGRGNPSNYWVDINASFQMQWNYKQYLVNFNYMYTSALNYRWTKLGGGFANPDPESDKINHQLSLSLFYLFNK